MIEVAETKDRDVLRRWMLRPAFVKKILNGAPITDRQLEAAFSSTVSSGARFFLVTKGGEERGVVVFKPDDGGWDMHLCLSTWFSDTREAVRISILRVATNRAAVFATYPSVRRSVTLLLNDVGFSKPKTVGGGFVTRQFIAVDTNTRCLPS